MKLSVIIVSWKVKEDLLNCLRSIKNNPPSAPFEVIVVDNASNDGSVEAVKDSFPETTLIVNKENKGFAAANNQALELSRGKYLLLLNPDTIIKDNALDRLIKFMDDNRSIGACGPKLLYPDGRTQKSVRHLPSFKGALYRHTIFGKLGVFKKSYMNWAMKDFDYNTETDVYQIMGAALLLRGEALDKVGPLDETFFMYYEEVDLCYRIKKAGWRVVFTPITTIVHLGGSSSKQTPAEKTVMAMNSLIKFFRKHYGNKKTTLYLCVFKPARFTDNLVNITFSAIKMLIFFLIGKKDKFNKNLYKLKKSSKTLSKYV